MAGPTRRVARAAPRSPASPSACGRTRTRSWTSRPSPRATAYGSRRRAANCWANSRRLAVCSTGRKSSLSPSLSCVCGGGQRGDLLRCPARHLRQAPDD
eukprot:3526606-Alexandrium_andersonii.AAC.1